MAKRTTGISFYQPPVTDDDIAAVSRVLRKGWLTSGPQTEALEHHMADRIGVRHAVAVSSGTIGLQIALQACGVGPGDDVITTPLTFTATAQAIIHLGANPVFADVIPGGLNLDPRDVERRVTKKTRALVPVGVGGIPCEMSKLRGIARRHKLIIVEDAAHTLGANYRGRPIGHWAKATVFSFYATKNLTTGEGGMVVTDSARCARHVRLLAHHGITRPTWARHAESNRPTFRYDVATLGYKANLSDPAAALGLSQLRRFGKLAARRRKVADWYHKALADCDLIDWPIIPRHAESSNHLCQILIRRDRLRVGRDAIWGELHRAGIPCSVHFIPLYHFTFYRRQFRLRSTDYPHAEEAFQRSLTLPLYPDLTRREVDHVCAELMRILEHHRR